MLGIITLILALMTQIGFLIYRMVTKNRQTRTMHIIRIAAFAIFSLLLLTGVYWWGFRWMGLFLLLAVLAVFSAFYFLRKPKAEKKYKGLTAILSCINGLILLTVCILPGILFPQFKPIAPTGSFAVDTTSVTFVDTSRVDPYSQAGENRKLTVQFYYPAAGDRTKTYPLVVFSHGAFGYRGSNRSTFENLASNGYVVCSIDHSHHAFFSKHTDGSNTLVDMDFLNDAANIENNAYDEQKTFDITKGWLAIRTADMNFVLDEILLNANQQNAKHVYTLIDRSKIGLFGHSLGGATAAQLGRERSDVDAAIVVDGTMIGEQTGLENGHRIFKPQAYPVPLLNLYNASHYDEACQLGTAYNNLSASSNAAEAYDVVIRGSGHLNFTDLPLFSPALARMLGTGSVDSRYCIDTMNRIVLEFFNHTLKDAAELQLQTEY